MIVDRNYDIRVVNVAARRLLGIHGAGLGEDLIHRVMPGVASGLRASIDAAFQGERSTTIHRLSDDVVEEGERDLSIACFPTHTDESHSSNLAVRIEVIDVTTFTRRQRELEEQRAQLQTERDNLHERAMTAVDEVRQLRAANEAMAAEAGRLRADNEQLQLSHEEVQAAAEEIETLNEEQQATNEELETVNEELQATIEELNTTNAELEARATELQALATTLDARQRESEAERARLEAILANMDDAVLVVDGEGRLARTNAAWEHFFGSTVEIPIEDESGQLLPRETWPSARVARGEAFTDTFTLPGSGGSRRWFEASGQPVTGDSDSRWGVIVVRDITDRSLRHLQQEFLAVAAHELRTPLTALSATIQLIARRLNQSDMPENMRELAGRALEQTWRLEAHIRDLVDVARLQAGRMRLDRAPVDLAAVVLDAVTTARSIAGEQQISVDAPGAPVTVNGDARRLGQVVLNLITNAITHAPDSDRIDIRLRREDDEVVLDVQDYGPGIPPEALPDIFSRFFQAGEHITGRDGLGLGLYIAREIVDAHGGTIHAHSTLSEGSRFEIRLPLLVEDGSATPDSESDAPT